MSFLLELNQKTIIGLNGIAVLAFILSALVTLGDVLLRYLLGLSIPGSFEIESMLMAFIVFCALPLTEMRRGHIRVDVVSRHFPPRIQFIAGLISLFLALFLWVGIAWFMGLWTLESWHSREFSAGEFPFPIYPIKFGAAVSSAIFACQFLVEIFLHFKNTPVETPEEGGNI